MVNISSLEKHNTIFSFTKTHRISAKQERVNYVLKQWQEVYIMK